MIAVGLAPMMEEQENLETRRVIRHRSEVGVCVISNYAVITELRCCTLCWSASFGDAFFRPPRITKIRGGVV